MTTFVEFVVARRAEILAALGQHVLLVVVATLAAIAIGVPLGILAARRPRIGAPLVGLASIVQTIPSLALFGFLIPLPLIGGVGPSTALTALIVYALLPVIRTTAAGLTTIDRVFVEASRALGLTAWQRLRHIDLPLALPQIVAGVRVAAVTSVGTATIAAAIGAGGLGEFIFRGLSMVSAPVILAGAIPAALLAVAVDATLSLVERRLGRRRRRGRSKRFAATAAALAVAAVIAGVMLRPAGRAVVVGSKNFTEQVVLGEIVAQTLERHGLRVDRKLNLGGSFICDRALMSGDIDLYVEYTGTALTAIFKEPVLRDRDAVLDRVRQRYAESGRTLLDPLGFNNTFAILVRGRDARTQGLARISDLAARSRRLRAGFGYEFLERDDGFPGLARTYGLAFAEPPRVMDLTLSYRALAGGEVDVIAGDSTAGLIPALDLVALEDDRHYFPPYDAVPVANTASLAREPDIRTGLATLSGRISDTEMRALNRAVDVDKRDPAAVAREFLEAVTASGRK